MFLYNSNQQFYVENRNFILRTNFGLTYLMHSFNSNFPDMQKAIFTLLVLLFSVSAVQAQKTSYINLINRAGAAQIFIDDIILPTEEGKTNVSIIFRFDNDFLPYKKITYSDKVEAPEGMGFYTIARLNAEIFEGKANRRRANNSEIASRDLWIDTLYTKTFEETESKKLYASGSLTNTLEVGEYNYVLQLSLMENTNERSSNPTNLKIVDWDKKKTGEVILIKEIGENKELPLMNLSDNVLFGKDFYSLIRIPNYNASSKYSINISKAKVTRRDTTGTESVLKMDISASDISENVLPTVTQGRDPSIILSKSEQDYTYALVKIPNATLDNSAYLLEVNSSESSEPIAKKLFRSYWPDMPASLLNLDISIDMMKHIVSEEALKEIKSGSQKEKETKFREFWASKDPTPNTIYNELMAEYYRRIDYSFREFGNRGNFDGHESDQGKVYIKYGPPVSTERQFPTNGKVLEVWNYTNKKFVFEASTGFGDFVLLGSGTE